jgi:hypothetical protein
MPVPREIRRNRTSRKSRKVMLQPGHSGLQKLDRNIHQKLLRPHAAAQASHLFAIARSQLYQHLATRHGLGDLQVVASHDGRLGSCGIVLGQLGYLLKQGAAMRVIKELGGNLRLPLHQPLRQFTAHKRRGVYASIKVQLSPEAVEVSTRSPEAMECALRVMQTLLMLPACPVSRAC